MSILENLPPQARKELEKLGWAKGIELAKVARRDKQHFDCATWLHKASELWKEDFQQAVERELTGKIAERERSFTSNSTRVSYRSLAALSKPRR